MAGEKKKKPVTAQQIIVAALFIVVGLAQFAPLGVTITVMALAGIVVVALVAISAAKRIAQENRRKQARDSYHDDDPEQGDR